MTVGHDFEATFREVYPRLVSLGVLKTGRLEVARDLAQETMFRANDRWDELADYDAPAMWCRVVMTNLLVDHYRSTASERSAVDRLGRQTVDGDRRLLDTGATPSLDRWNDLVRPTRPAASHRHSLLRRLWAAAAAAVTVGVGGLWPTRANGDDTVPTADPPATGPLAAPTTVEADAPSTDSPAATIASSASTTTVAPPSTTIAETGTPVLPVPGTIELGASDLVARETDGDAWWYPDALTDQPGEPVLLIDRADPRIVPSEGEGANVIDEVAGTFDGSLIYSDCCEPVSGNVFAIGEPGAEVDRSSPTGLSDRFQLWGVGANPHLEPDGTRVLMHGWDFVNVIDMSTGDQQFVSTLGSFADADFNMSGPPFNLDDAAWTSNGTIALLGRSDTDGVILSEHDANDVRIELRRTELDLIIAPQTQGLGPIRTLQIRRGRDCGVLLRGLCRLRDTQAGSTTQHRKRSRVLLRRRIRFRRARV